MTRPVDLCFLDALKRIKHGINHLSMISRRFFRFIFSMKSMKKKDEKIEKRLKKEVKKMKKPPKTLENQGKNNLKKDVTFY